MMQIDERLAIIALASLLIGIALQCQVTLGAENEATDLAKPANVHFIRQQLSTA
jgi:hypothetical protein